MPALVLRQVTLKSGGMNPVPANTNPLVKICWEVMTANGWCNSNDALSTHSIVQSIQEKLANETCMFRMLLNLDRETPNLKLSSSFRNTLKQLTQVGLSLHLDWPRAHATAIKEWLGQRFYFSVSTNFAATERYVSLASSQLGRHSSKIPNWPSLVDAALQHTSRDRERPLLLPGTSLSEATQQFSNRANLNGLQIKLDDRQTIENWLSDLLSELERTYKLRALETTAQQSLTILRLSPPAIQTIAPEIATMPLQDRVAIALADRVMVLHIRSNGIISKLTERRLADHRFPSGTVFIASTFGQHSTRQPDFEKWLERGAVGWLLQEPALQLDHFLANCRKECSPPFIQSLCSPMPAHWFADSMVDCDWRYLAHCTRGNSGPLPDENMERFRDRAWNAGVIPNSHPLTTLQQILLDQCIKGNSWLTRSQQPCVSFSEVPLAKLLSRRQFRPHLGRWDWEPYGLLVRREALERLGARPVIYGDEAEYKQLDDVDKPYFQPLGTKSARNNYDWSSEREWRLFGNLNLTAVPRESVCIFVATRAEAQQVARRCQWPVLWKSV